MKKIKISALEVRDGIQQRVGAWDEDYVGELTQWLLDHPEGDLPPIVAFAENLLRGPHVLAGGHYRLAAYQAAKRKEIPADQRKGTWRDALRFALADNADHGKRRSAADVKNAVTTALHDPEFSQLSDREIDRLCRVYSGYTSVLKKKLTGAAPDPAKQVGARASNAAQGKSVCVSHANSNLGTDHEKDETTAEAKAETRRSSSGPESGDGNRLDGRAGDVQRGDAGRDDTTGNPGDPEAVGRVVLPRDRLGRVIPGYLVAVFEQGRAILDAASAARSAKAKADRANAGELVGGFLTRNPGIGPALQTAAGALTRSAPFCVCPACGGDGDSEECPTCGGCGWLNAAQFEHLPAVLQEQARSFKPGDTWPGWDEPEPPSGLAPTFAPPGPGLDALGNRIPKRLRDFFADEWLAATAAELRITAQSLRDAGKWNPHLSVKLHGDLMELAGQIDGARPYAVCDCGGTGCPACLTAGFLPAWQRHEIAKG